jgi:transposase
MNHSRVLGIDVSKKRLDCAVFPHSREGAFSLENCEAGATALLDCVQAMKPEVVALEASGGCERLIVARLREAGVTVLVLQPAAVRAFATLRGRKAKNDRLDAQLIAEFAARFGEARAPRPAAWDRFAELLTYYEQVAEDAALVRTCLASLHDPEIRDRATARLKALAAEKTALLARLRALVAELPELAARVKLLATMPGIGFLNAVNLAVRMPELGRLSNKAVAALAGLAPFDDDSGERAGQRSIRGGRGRVRRLLFMGAMSAIRVNPIIKALYARLIARGRAHKSAVTAAMRKMIVTLNAMMRTQQPWFDITQPEHA